MLGRRSESFTPIKRALTLSQASKLQSSFGSSDAVSVDTDKTKPIEKSSLQKIAENGLNALPNVIEQSESMSSDSETSESVDDFGLRKSAAEHNKSHKSFDDHYSIYSEVEDRTGELFELSVNLKDGLDQKLEAIKYP